ncbi:nucleotide-sugar transporter-domain-containing protein [Syncephalastrum racemosum]|uniref:Nucleotide-sugar transporter-domain-containing protein n=1 Tax=Syncephalastrum racemosum TaxID=13706 RepID=A0A1X2HWQ8_SYNRA|nr:nucleotide-sugar transporter-domain-containing protein [Syncephalastrum racemosum]
MMRYSRVKGQGSQGEEADSATYAASTAVFMAEMIKMVLCVIMIRITEPDKRIAYEVFGKPRETLRMVIPSGLYALQNNLLYIALTHLEAATFQVTYQLKILSTAIFSVLLLGRSLSTQQWIALVLLMVGVTLVQMESSGTNDETSDPGAHGKNSIMGLTAVLASCVSSGFSGCYFEKLLKTSRTSMWVRNLQLGVCGATFSFVGMLLADGVAVWQHGMFHGYSLLTWLVVINQALGGLLVATVVKYADNILKGFATSLSILLSGLITFYFFDFSPSPAFLVGATVVILATYLYGRAMKTPTHSSSAPSTAISTVKLH